MNTGELELKKSRSFAWQDYCELAKPKVVMLILFTAMVGMLLSTPGLVPWQPLVFGLLGIGLASAGGAAFNHVIDQRIDAIMERTKSRPLPAGGVDTLHAISFAFALVAIAIGILEIFVNSLTAILTALAFIGYALIYTIYLKRSTPQNIVWGGLAGAMPPLLGWTAVTGHLDIRPFLLVLLVFVWTPPHFWALAIRRRAEYAQADIPMLPVTHGVAHTKLQILLYTLLLLIVSIMPVVVHMSGLLYLIGAVLFGLGFLYQAYRLFLSEGDEYAMPTFNYSVLYLTAVFSLLLLDHYL